MTRRLNLGCGRSPLANWINVDSTALPGVDLVRDLEKGPLPYDDGSVEEIRASHFLEHVVRPLSLMQELHRVAKPDALATFRVPYGSSDDADEDPTHVRRYFVGSWGYFRGSSKTRKLSSGSRSASRTILLYALCEKIAARYERSCAPRPPTRVRCLSLPLGQRGAKSGTWFGCSGR